jgi:hypothetical protein
MDPRDNVDLAVFLSRRPQKAPPEAALRGACGRAYYAAFIVARDALERAGQLRGSDSLHGLVPNLLKTSSNKALQDAGSLLGSLRVTRNSADYEAGMRAVRGRPFDTLRAVSAISQAQTIIGSIEAVARSDTRLGLPEPTTKP